MTSSNFGASLELRRFRGFLGLFRALREGLLLSLGGRFQLYRLGKDAGLNFAAVFEADVGLFLGRAWGAIHVAMGDWRLPITIGPWAKNIREALRNTLTSLNKHAGRSTTLSKAFTSHSQRNSPFVVRMVAVPSLQQGRALLSLSQALLWRSC